MMINSSSYSYSYSSLLIFCFFYISVRASTAAIGLENPLFEYSTRMDMVELAGYGEEKLSSVLVIGSVHCDVSSCDTENHGGQSQLHAWPIQGASVAVTCKTHGGKRRRITGAHGTTDEYGDFVIDLPSNLHANPNLDKVCVTRVLRLPTNSPCQKVFTRKAIGIRLSSVGNSIRTYTAGSITFRHSINTAEPCPKNGETEYKNQMIMRF